MISPPNQPAYLPANTTAGKPVYIFLDESGNLDFSAKGTRYFVLTSVTMRRPFPAYAALDSYRYECLEQGADIEYVHCAEDNKPRRAAVFRRIADSLDEIRIDSFIVEKPKTGPSLQADRRFYPEMLGYLLKWIAPQVQRAETSELIVVTDSLPIKRQLLQ